MYCTFVTLASKSLTLVDTFANLYNNNYAVFSTNFQDSNGFSDMMIINIFYSEMQNADSNEFKINIKVSMTDTHRMSYNKFHLAESASNQNSRNYNVP